MARFLLVLKPELPAPASALIDGLAPVLDALHAEVDHRTPGHLGALIRGGHEGLRTQLFIDVQSRADGPELELVLMSRESMGQGAPHTLGLFQTMLNLMQQHDPSLQLCFRSDRDGALPR